MKLSDNRTHWNRRTFLATSGLAAAATITPRLLAAEFTKPASIACVAHGNHIQLFHARATTWLPLTEPTACHAPRCLALHPTRDVLYIAHDAEQYRNLPRAYISGFSIDRGAGSLQLVGEFPLTLSATRPQHLSISPDGSALLVSATGGGAYNIFALAPDGSIDPDPQAMKQTGRGPHTLQASAQPRASVFDRTRPIAYACDFGADRIDWIDFSAEHAAINVRTPLAPGTGPQHVALHPYRNLLVVASALQPTLHLVDLERGDVPTQETLPVRTSAGPLCFNESGDTLYATAITPSHNLMIVTYKLGAMDSQLQLMAVKETHMGEARQIFSHHGSIFLACTAGIARIDTDTLTVHDVLRRRDVTGIALLAV
jgi:6-phosphogluconolactonase (cycloisomerase 2 family)